jgi:two-component system, LuxR family, sensor kinase FixL
MGCIRAVSQVGSNLDVKRPTGNNLCSYTLLKSWGGITDISVVMGVEAVRSASLLEMERRGVAGWLIVPTFLVLYVLIDWITYTPAFAPLGITPWAPSIGLGFGLVLLRGTTYAPLIAIASFVTDIVARKLPFAWWVTAIEATLIGAVYTLALTILLSPQARFDRTLSSVRDVLLLAGVSIVAAFLVAMAYCGVLLALGLMPPEQMIGAVLRYGIGDLIGILVLTPCILLLATRRLRWRPTRQGLGQVLAILAAVFLVVGLAGHHQQHFFYILLLPIVWIAVTGGLDRVAAGLVLMQIGIMVMLHFGKADVESVTAFQAIMIVLTFAGLTIGGLVSERTRAEQRLRLQQELISGAARHGSAGELAAALAHELNQPLTAVSNYTRAVLGQLRRSEPDLASAVATAEKAVQQTERAAQVVRRLRDLIQIGRLQTAEHDVEQLIAESIELSRPALLSSGTEVTVAVPLGVPTVRIDLIQIEQVMTNLLRNAMEAMAEVQAAHRRIEIGSQVASDRFVEVSVTDGGPGFPPGFELGSFTPGDSHKPGGLGVGLALCQSIIKAHGGTLEAVNSRIGATVRFTLPIA